MQTMGSKLLGIVRVPENERVRCQNPGCGHGVHAAIHIVREGGVLMVLGSTCFERRYGSAKALGQPQFNFGGSGRPLTTEERELLDTNTDLLLARFEEEERQRLIREQAQAQEQEQEQRRLAAQMEERRREAQRLAARSTVAFDPREKLRALRAAFANKVIQEPVPRVFTQHQEPDGPVAPPSPPWAQEVKLNGSFFCYAFDDGSKWVLYPHKKGDYVLRPWPAAEEGWDEALPPSLGRPEPESGFYRVTDHMGFLHAVARFSTGLRNTSNPAEIHHEFEVLARKA
ncbi:hypothetical protein [Comamonas sp. 23]|uniref:hypothetical protein n=1 Tax=Comamonas sp. 23 TaxID=3415008 RepID=UPI003C6EA689